MVRNVSPFTPLSQAPLFSFKTKKKSLTESFHSYAVKIAEKLPIIFKVGNLFKSAISGINLYKKNRHLTNSVKYFGAAQDSFNIFLFLKSSASGLKQIVFRPSKKRSRQPTQKTLNFMKRQQVLNNKKAGLTKPVDTKKPVVNSNPLHLKTVDKTIGIFSRVIGLALIFIEYDILAFAAISASMGTCASSQNIKVAMALSTVASAIISSILAIQKLRKAKFDLNLDNSKISRENYNKLQNNTHWDLVLNAIDLIKSGAPFVVPLESAIKISLSFTASSVGLLAIYKKSDLKK